jgi:hypothetical protein
VSSTRIEELSDLTAAELARLREQIRELWLPLVRLSGEPRPPDARPVHSPDYVASVVLRLLRTGEASFDIPHGPEQPGLAQLPQSA